MRPSHVFLVALLFSLIMQGIYWHHFVVLDAGHWVHATESLMTLSYEMFDEFTYGYPGTPPMMLAIGIHWLFGLPVEQAFYGSLAVVVSIGCALAALICKLCRPHLLWWVGTMAALSTTTLYRHATPPSVVAIPYVVVMVLLSLYIFENRSRSQKWPVYLLGVATGVATAGRFDIALFVAGIQALFLWPLIGSAAVVLTALIAFLVLGLLNPFLWIFPVHHISAFVHKIFYHYSDMREALPPLGVFFKTSPFSWLGLLYGIIIPFSRGTRSFVHRMFMLNLLFLTVVQVTLLYFATYRPLWYFSPLLVTWEVIFLLLLLELVSHATYTLGFNQKTIIGMYLVARVGVLLLLASNHYPALFFFT